MNDIALRAIRDWFDSRPAWLLWACIIALTVGFPVVAVWIAR